MAIVMGRDNQLDLAFEHAVLVRSAHFAYDTVNPLGDAEQVEKELRSAPQDKDSWAPSFDCTQKPLPGGSMLPPVKPDRGTSTVRVNTLCQAPTEKKTIR